jgi:Gluconate 2-dehydrogenase subunit 3
MSDKTVSEGHAAQALFRPGSLSPEREASGADVLTGTRGLFTVLDQARARVLTCWCAELIPAAANRPSAADVGAAEYTDRVCASSGLLRAALISAVDRLDADARDRSGCEFADCSSARRTDSLHALAADEPALFALVLNLVYEAYYSTPSVLAELERATGWRAANALHGSAMAAFDESLLEHVRSLPRGYREA